MARERWTSEFDEDDDGDLASEDLPPEEDLDADQDLVDHEYDDEIAPGTCPACHSQDVAAFSWSRRIGQALVVLLLLAPLAILGAAFITISIIAMIYTLITKPDFRCTRCGRRWTKADARLG